MALSDQEIVKIQPGALISLPRYLAPVDESLILTVEKFTWSGVTSVFRLQTLEFKFLETGPTRFLLTPNSISFVASSLEAVPPEDWAGLAHLLHPKLQERVEEWLSRIKI